MEQFDKDNKEVFDIVNQNSVLRNKILEEGLKNYNDALERAKNKSKGAYREKKFKKRKQINKSIIAIVLASTAFISIYNSVKSTKAVMNSKNAIVHVDNETKDKVDERINDYEKLMNMYSDKNNRIENSYGRNSQNNDVIVDYNVNNLAKHIVNASQISESEMRCAIIASYKIINSPYVNEILNKAFLIAKDDENMSGYSKELIENGTKGFLEKLSYENWEEYQKNERNSIKDLKALEDFIGGRNRWAKKNYAMLLH